MLVFLHPCPNSEVGNIGIHVYFGGLAKQEKGQAPWHQSIHDNLSTKVDDKRECGHQDLSGAWGVTLEHF